MKDNVEIYTLALIEVIHDSDDYKRFLAVKKKVDQDEQLKKEINAYRMEAFRLQNEGSQEDLFERTEAFGTQYQQFRDNPLVEEYLTCELAVCRMLQTIARRVVGSVDLGLEDVVSQIHI